MTPERAATVGVILAGGLARRMGGGHKMLRSVGGESVLARLIARLKPQVGALALNLNTDPALFAEFALPVVPDDLPGNPGPLAGILAGLDWAAREMPSASWLVSVPGDAPFIPADLAVRLQSERRLRGAELACAASAGRTHPVIGLWPLMLRTALRRALVEDIRKIDRFTARYATISVEWPAEPLDPFFNVNRPEDLAEADRLAACKPLLSRSEREGRAEGNPDPAEPRSEDIR
ncbi:MAG: molybdenum cofactor guanylyltransferase MobA [Acetobacteraceae bacterium]